jgi:NhaP-type Na+/H+ and K+/H+ antiporter
VTTIDLGLVLLVGAVVVLAAIVAARVAHGIGLPGLLLFLGLGWLWGRRALVSGSMMPRWRRRWGSARWC